jgi:hypothetical protein
MAKWKRAKGQTIIYKTPHGKLKIEQHEPLDTGGEVRMGKQFLLQI